MSSLTKIQNRIDATKKRGNRTTQVTLMGATKTVPPEFINKFIDSGLSLIGENRIQEAEEKFSQISSVEKHFIGHLQTNKVKKALELFDCIESVDSLKLAEQISKQAKNQITIFLEVNIGREENKYGFLPEEVKSAYEEISSLPNIEVNGFMCIPPIANKSETRNYFKKMRELKNSINPELKLSMGMSSDFEIAIEEGADIVRVGSALFGKR